MPPFDPNLPQPNTPADANLVRGQLTSLHDLITAIQAVTAVQVDGVTTLPAGSQASVSLQLTGNTLHFTFGIPEGTPGAQGGPGQDGGPGPIGPQGPPFAQAVVDGVTTLPAGSNASVTVSFDGTNVRFNFEIPQGNDGATGATGQPGEVTQAALDSAISGTSSNTNAVGTLDTLMADPDDEALRQKLNEFILAGRR